jgi:hypothetical protein
VRGEVALDAGKSRHNSGEDPFQADDNLRIKLRSGLASDLNERVRRAPGSLIWARGCERVVHVRHGHDPAEQRNLLGPQAPGIAWTSWELPPERMFPPIVVWVRMI